MKLDQTTRHQPPSFQAYALGDTAIVLQFDDKISPNTLENIRTFALALDRNPFPGFVEWVPAYTTLTVFYNPLLVNEKGRFEPYTRVLEHLQNLDHSPLQTDAQAPVLLHEIPVCYGEAFGPDLEQVAKHNGFTPEEVIRLHTEPEYLVYMIGFAPGFPYLGGMNPRLTTPRKETPKPRIPAGSVGIGGGQTGIYPLETPGGWQLIGKTPLRLFRPDADQPSLLQAGNRVRFLPITASAYQDFKEVTP